MHGAGSAGSPTVQVPAFGDEHKELALVTPDEAVALNMPEGYRTAICLAVDGGHVRIPLS
jgi:hypothetical protein